MRAVSVRVNTKTAKGAAGEGAHAHRTGRIPDYVDQSRMHQNSEPVPFTSPGDLSDLCLSRRQSRYDREAAEAPARQPGQTGAKYKPRKMAQNAAVSVAGIITFGTEAKAEIEALEPAEQDRRFKEAADKIADDLNTSLEGLVIHRDESSVHAHFQLAAYDKNGEPLSQTLDITRCSKLQDVGAEAYADLEITRGKKKAQRIAEGEDFSKTVHRSVRQLHQDLPEEIAAEQQKLGKAQERRETAERKAQQAEQARDAAGREAEQYRGELKELEQQKGTTQADLDAAQQKLADAEAARQKEQAAYDKLRKRADNAQKREQKAEERLAHLKEKDWSFPKPRKGTALVGDAPYIGKPETREVRFFRASEVNDWREKTLMQADESDKNARKADERAKKADKIVDELNRNTATIKRETPHSTALKAAQATVQERYGVIIERTPGLVRIPPNQEPDPSHKQKAAALYRAAKEQFPEGMIRFNVRDEATARTIIDYAEADDMLGRIQFADEAHETLHDRALIEYNERHTKPQKPEPEPQQEQPEHRPSWWDDEPDNDQGNSPGLG
ncbi:hypothetical protein [Haloferax sp. KTX1]|uniref:hypothetical protein n=1 Tax=Haloferax sp. KTX1 TaxID=2600597 RepID=UPI001652864B|nr:hypothetical protein [Haloferax sp. KTX1]